MSTSHVAYATDKDILHLSPANSCHKLSPWSFANPELFTTPRNTMLAHSHQISGLAGRHTSKMLGRCECGEWLVAGIMEYIPAENGAGGLRPCF